MRLEILCGGGSPQGVHVSDIYGQNGRIGVGGAELALLTLCEGWARAGNEVVLYNNPKRQDGIFEQRNIDDFDRVDRRGDVVIFFREPSTRVVNVKKSLKVFWSCDQYTAGDYSHFSALVDKVVTISPHHSQYFEKVYGIQDSIPIDLPVRTWDYEGVVEKSPHKIIFTSVPDRGLKHVAQTFPRIKEQVPDATLVITSDYRLWGAISPFNNQYVQMFMSMGGVEFLGGVTRDRLIHEQLSAQIHYYPCDYEELFCIAVAESQIAGVYPITSAAGALRTTNMGMLIEGSMDSPVVQQIFVQTAIEHLMNPNLANLQKELQCKAKERFSMDNILSQWNEKVFNG